MCGIFGFVTDVPNKGHYETFRKVLLLSVYRGKDATGLVIVGKDGTITMHKLPVTAIEYAEKYLPKYEEAISTASIVLGHVREWTQGPPSDNNNNHPIESEKWWLVHNGGLHSLPKLEGYKYKGECDSEIWLSYVEKFGIKEAITYLGYGTGAIAMINKEDPLRLFLARYISPLYAALHQKEHTIFFASEEKILEPVLKDKQCWFSNYQIVSIPEKTVYDIKISPLKVNPIFPFIVKQNSSLGTYYHYKFGAGQAASTNIITNISPPSVASPPVYSAPQVNMLNEIQNTKLNSTEQTSTYSEETYIYQTRIRAWVKDYEMSPITKGKDSTNRYYFMEGSKEFTNWNKLVNAEGWISSDLQLYKKWDREVKKHFIMSLDDAIEEGELGMVARHSFIKRLTCPVRVYLSDKDEIVGFSLTPDAFKALEDEDYNLIPVNSTKE